jgi:hypothetical protein
VRLVGFRIQNILLRPGKKLGCPQGGGFIGPIRTQPPTRHVIPMKVLRRPPIREGDFKAPAQRDGFMLDDADAGGHDTIAWASARSRAKVHHKTATAVTASEPKNGTLLQKRDVGESLNSPNTIECSPQRITWLPNHAIKGGKYRIKIPIPNNCPKKPCLLKNDQKAVTSPPESRTCSKPHTGQPVRIFAGTHGLLPRTGRQGKRRLERASRFGSRRNSPMIAMCQIRRVGRLTCGF